METCDVTVVGAGIMGCFITYYLCKLNATLKHADRFKIIWLDQFGKNHDKGSSHGDGRIMRIGSPDLTKARMAQLSYKLFKELQEECNKKLMHENIEYLSFAHKDNKQLINEYKNNALLSIQQSVISNHNTININTENYEVGLLQSQGTAILFADKILNNLHDIIQNKYNIKLRENCKITSIDRHKFIATYIDPHGIQKRIKFTKKIILATGAYTNIILSSSNIKTFPYSISNEQVCYFKPKKGFESKYEISDNEQYKNMPVFIRHPDNRDLKDNHNEQEYIFNKYYFYGIPMIVKDFGVKVDVECVERCNYGEPLNLDDLRDNKRSFECNEHLLKYSQMFARQYLPDLDVDEYRTLRCLYTIPQDDEFIIGNHYESENIFLCFGFCGMGFKFSAFIGLCIARKILDYDSRTGHLDFDEYNIDLLAKYDPNRFLKLCKL